MIRIIVLLSVVAGLFLPPAYGENNAGSATAQAKSIPQRGTLYRIRHRESTAWLFGTIHVGRADFFPLAPEVTQALAQADRLVLELDVRDDASFQAALQKHGMYADDDTIDRHLSSNTLEVLQVELNRAGIPFAQVARMKPWLVTNLLVAEQLARAGYDRNHGSEILLLAQAANKPLQGLESAEYQMSLFDEMSAEDQEQYLREQLAGLSSGDSLRKARALIDAWADANSAVLEQVVRESLAEKSLSSDFMQRELLDRRNPAMAARIAALLTKRETSFVAVGLLHLLGDNGLPALLRQRGYDVVKVW